MRVIEKNSHKIGTKIDRKECEKCGECGAIYEYIIYSYICNYSFVQIIFVFITENGNSSKLFKSMVVTRAKGFLIIMIFHFDKKNLSFLKFKQLLDL